MSHAIFRNHGKRPKTSGESSWGSIPFPALIILRTWHDELGDPVLLKRPGTEICVRTQTFQIPKSRIIVIGLRQITVPILSDATAMFVLHSYIQSKAAGICSGLPSPLPSLVFRKKISK